jgi:signal transduction histidine kinase
LIGYFYYSGVCISAIGVILLLLRRPRYWGYGVLMLFILLGGYFVQYFISQPDSDYVRFVQLGEMAGYLLLLTLPMRLVDQFPVAEPADIDKASKVPTTGASTQLLQLAMNLLTETSPQQYYQELTRVVAYAMNADFCLLMLQPKTGDQLIVPVAYSRLEDRMLDGFAAEAAKIPSILEAIKSGKTFRTEQGRLDSEVQTLSDVLGSKQASQLMMVPFQLQGISAVMSLGVVSRPAVTTWNDEDTQQLKEIAEILVSKAGQYSKGASRQSGQLELTQKIQRAEAYADQVRLEYAQLKAKYDSISSDVTGPAAQAEDMAALLQNQKDLQETISQLENRNRELENLLTRGRPSMEEVEQLRQELRSALTDLARMPSTLSKSDQRMLELQVSTVKHLDAMQPTELVTSIAQEFRQPLSSIMGYTDLLLGESVGILGAVQRKFLERVKASTERLGMLMNELVQVMSIDGGKVDQTPVSVDLKSVIDEAAGSVSAQASEKNISIRVNLPDMLPTILVNRDALQQIIVNLLENAIIVTPADGEITLLARAEQKENNPSYIMISVTDQGGGIEQGDMQRVFLRRYKMENPLIQGIGDAGVGLSIVKSLVELYKGRVWVDTSEGVGSTFSVLLPLAEDQPGQVNQTISTG